MRTICKCQDYMSKPCLYGYMNKPCLYHFQNLVPYKKLFKFTVKVELDKQKGFLDILAKWDHIDGSRDIQKLTFAKSIIVCITSSLLFASSKGSSRERSTGIEHMGIKEESEGRFSFINLGLDEMILLSDIGNLLSKGLSKIMNLSLLEDKGVVALL